MRYKLNPTHRGSKMHITNPNTGYALCHHKVLTSVERPFRGNGDQYDPDVCETCARIWDAQQQKGTAVRLSAKEQKEVDKLRQWDKAAADRLKERLLAQRAKEKE